MDSIFFWVLASIGVILTGISKSGFAAGGGVVITPLIALIIPIDQAVFFALPLLLVMDIKIIQYYYKSIDKKQLIQIIPAGLIGVMIGGFSIHYLSAEILSLLLGLVCIIFALWQALISWLAKFEKLGFFWGLIAGFTSTLIHAGGPPLNIYLLSKKLPKLVALSSASVFFGVVNLMKGMAYLLTDNWAVNTFLTSLILIPLAFFGAYLGKGIQNIISEENFVRCCRGLLLISGIVLIIKIIF